MMARPGTRVLHFGFTRTVGCVSRAFERHGASVESVFWRDEKDPVGALSRALERGPFDLTFLQIQRAGVLRPEWVKQNLKGFVVNWCGDVRKPRPRWYDELHKCVSVTSFSNLTDLAGLYRVSEWEAAKHWLGDFFDPSVFHPSVPRIEGSPEVVFMGSYHPRQMFDETTGRVRMVRALREHYGPRFGLYGRHWPADLGAIDNSCDYANQASVYASAKVGINQAHFRYARYYSDRIFRIMGSGAACLSQSVPLSGMDFVDGSDFLEWNTVDEMISKCDLLLRDDEMRSLIAKNGCAQVHARHTVDARCRTVLGWAGCLDGVKTPAGEKHV